MSKKLKQLKYDCNKCPAYCCSYEEIPVTKKDMKRISSGYYEGDEHGWKEIKKVYTTKVSNLKGRILRHKKDTVYDTVCTFLDRNGRTCMIYETRPEVCRTHPHQKRCGYYEFLTHERMIQEDQEYIP